MDAINYDTKSNIERGNFVISSQIIVYSNLHYKMNLFRILLFKLIQLLAIVINCSSRIFLWYSVSVVRSESVSRPTQTDNWGSTLICLPPIITHTAATPQGSPNATLESINSSHLSPQSALTISEHQTSETSLAADGNSTLQLVSFPMLHFPIIAVYQKLNHPYVNIDYSIYQNLRLYILYRMSFFKLL